MEYPVGAAHFEPADILHAAEPLFGMRQGNVSLAVANLDRPEPRAFAGDIGETVGLVECHEGQSVPYVAFILGVDIGCLVGFHQVVRANHAAVGDEFPCLPLRFAQIGAVAAAIGEGGDLDVIERDIALLPERTPQPYHVGKADSIVLILVYVRFALIPQEAADGIPRHGV